MVQQKRYSVAFLVIGTLSFYGGVLEGEGGAVPLDVVAVLTAAGGDRAGLVRHGVDRGVRAAHKLHVADNHGLARLLCRQRACGQERHGQAQGQEQFQVPLFHVCIPPLASFCLLRFTLVADLQIV